MRRANKMSNKFVQIALSIILVPTIVLAAPGERDPFQPYALSKPTLATSQTTTKTTGENIVNITPLTEDALSSYKITGLIISPKDSIILVQARDKHEYFTTIGDKIGSEGGIIKKVSSEGITVDIEGKLVDLTVNKNRLDIQNETTN
jgi:Tfp pilus assembly protein PilP